MIYDIPAVRFNGTIYTHMELTTSAIKHFGEDSERYYRYVVGYLDGQTWTPTQLGTDGTHEFLTASATSYIKGIYAQSDYRETWFRVVPETATVQFFHGCSITKNQYEKAAHKMKLQTGAEQGGT